MRGLRRGERHAILDIDGALTAPAVVFAEGTEPAETVRARRAAAGGGTQAADRRDLAGRRPPGYVGQQSARAVAAAIARQADVARNARVLVVHPGNDDTGDRAIDGTEALDRPD